MLTKAEALSEVRAGQVWPDRLSRKYDPQYATLAVEMLKIYGTGTRRTRGELHREIEARFYGEKCPPKRIKAFCKLLDDASEYEEAPSGKIADLRMRVFSLAAKKHPLVRRPISLLAHSEAAVKAEIAQTLGRAWNDIEGELFSDVYELQRLKVFEGYESPGALLARYNEAQIQAALYAAMEVNITARGDYRAIVMAAKRAGLMHEARRRPDHSFHFTFYGPVSPLRTTRRYGVLLARIIPILLNCADWELSAPIKFFKSGSQPRLLLTSRDNYKSSQAKWPEFDSALERNFAERWGAAPRDGWRLERESEPRFSGQTAFFPDFTFVHANGQRVPMEIVGHWTPEYLKAKRETFRKFQDESLILAVGSKEAEAFADCAAAVIPFKTALKTEPFIAILAKLLKPQYASLSARQRE